MSIISISAQNLSPIAASGLIWDFFGAYFLAKALIFSKDQSIGRQAGTYWDLSIPLLRALCEQRLDARFGIGMLMTGFSLQFVAALGVTTDWPAIFLLVFPILLVFFTYRRNYDRWLISSCLRIAGRLGVERKLWRQSYFQDLPEDIFRQAFDYHEAHTSPHRAHRA